MSERTRPRPLKNYRRHPRVARRSAACAAATHGLTRCGAEKIQTGCCHLTRACDELLLLHGPSTRVRCPTQRIRPMAPSTVSAPSTLASAAPSGSARSSACTLSISPLVRCRPRPRPCACARASSSALAFRSLGACAWARTDSRDSDGGSRRLLARARSPAHFRGHGARDGARQLLRAARLQLGHCSRCYLWNGLPRPPQHIAPPAHTRTHAPRTPAPDPPAPAHTRARARTPQTPTPDPLSHPLPRSTNTASQCSNSS